MVTIDGAKPVVDGGIQDTARFMERVLLDSQVYFDRIDAELEYLYLSYVPTLTEYLAKGNGAIT